MFLLRLISYLPLGVLYFFSDILYFNGYHIFRYRRDVVTRNLQKAFPEKSDAERRTIGRAFYHSLCDYTVEALKLMTLSKAEVMKRIAFKNPEVAGKYAQQGQAMLYLTTHHFNWEWMLARVCMEDISQIYYVYQKQSSRFFDDYSNFIRMRFGAKPVLRERVGRELIRLRGQQFALANLADQFPGMHQDKRTWTRFLNQDTAFFQGINQMPVLTQLPVILFISRKVKRGYYEVELVSLGEPPYPKDETSILSQYADHVEKEINSQPENWLWSHNRWKKSRKEMGDA